MHRRFDRLGRLVGDLSFEKLQSSHVAVVGLGGVGSWAAEMLARSAVGQITLIDFDEICVTNFNRQSHALQGLIGQKKAEVLRDRLVKINPQGVFNARVEFFNSDTCNSILDIRPDFWIDAIDSITWKCLLLSECKKRNMPIITATGSAARMDPTRVKIVDLSETQKDPLAKSVRRILRSEFGFPETGEFGIPAVYSDEPHQAPKELKYDNGAGFKCVCPQGENTFFNCDNRNVILGTFGPVPAAFGMACVSHVVRTLIHDRV